ncbi:MAG: hypothetical protein LBR68_06080 [Lachnoclostridium sp.]|jgi:hypothetical protein|nr:hypothetical protein [Lachnoclostridium sp.]
MRKLFYVSLLLLVLSSCNTEDAKIRRSLKEIVAGESSQKYKLLDYQIVETILKNNLQDSISNYEVDKQVKHTLLQRDSVLFSQYINKNNDCIRQKNQAPYYIGSMYNSLIRDWEDMIVKQQDAINLKLSEIDSLSSKIDYWGDLIAASPSPIVYYQIKHRYTINGAHKEAIVLLTTDYKPLN